MSRVIAFSGGCFSGKTTTMKIVKEQLESAGYKVTVLDEIIRTVTDEPIDKIRKNPSAYLDLQEKIITAKIEQELKAFEEDSNTIYLADRAITDSLFYLQNYVDKSNLTPDETTRFCALHKYIVRHAKIAFGEFGYYTVIEFKPLNGKNADKYRPDVIDVSKVYEYDAISLLNQAFRGIVPFWYVDLNKDSVHMLVDSIKYLLSKSKIEL